MMERERRNIHFWIIGVIVSLLGVCLVKVFSPKISGDAVKWVAALGYFLSLAGIGIIIFGIRNSHKGG